MIDARLAPLVPRWAVCHVVSGRKPSYWVTAAWCSRTRRKPCQASACQFQRLVRLRGQHCAAAPFASRRPLRVNSKVPSAFSGPSRSKAANLAGSLRAGMPVPVPASAVSAIAANLARSRRDDLPSLSKLLLPPRLLSQRPQVCCPRCRSNVQGPRPRGRPSAPREPVN